MGDMTPVDIVGNRISNANNQIRITGPSNVTGTLTVTGTTADVVFSNGMRNPTICLFICFLSHVN